MIEMDLQFNRADVADFGDNMSRLIKECGMSPAAAGTYALVTLLKTVRASTKKSKKLRKYRADSRTLKRSGRSKRRYTVQGFNADGNQKEFKVYARDLAELKASPFVKIRHSGLARAAYGWAMRDIVRRGSAPRVGFRKPSGVIGGYMRKGEGSFSALIENNLKYARKAFRTSGDRTLDTAMERANKSMMYLIEKRLVRSQR